MIKKTRASLGSRDAGITEIKKMRTLQGLRDVGLKLREASHTKIKRRRPYEISHEPYEIKPQCGERDAGLTMPNVDQKRVASTKQDAGQKESHVYKARHESNENRVYKERCGPKESCLQSKTRVKRVASLRKQDAGLKKRDTDMRNTNFKA